VLPFFVLAPGSWYRDVVLAQVSRQDVTRVSAWQRVQSLAGLSVLHHAPHAAVLVAAVALAGFALVCSIAVWVRTRHPPPALELFAGLTAVLIVAAFLWPPDYYPHYAWFFAPFLALVLGLPAGRLATDGLATGARTRSALALLVTLAAAALAVVVGVRQLQQLSGLRSGEPAPFVQRHTPAGACVLADIPTVTILADRFVSRVPACSRMVDPIGTSYALTRGRNGVTGAGRNPAVRARWRAAFGAAGYVWLQCPPWVHPQCLTSRRVPWTRSLRADFVARFEAVPGQGRVANLYVRRDP
jgi:hypothetical protein